MTSRNHLATDQSQCFRSICRVLLLGMLYLTSCSQGSNPTTDPQADSTPPNPPAGLTATPISISQMDLSWSPSSDNTGTTGYLVERCAGASCSSFAQIGTSATTTFSDSGLVAQTTYSYRVRARDAAANLSSYSNVATASTPAAVVDTEPPTAPAGLAAVPVSSIQLALSWTAATDNIAVTGYLIERCTGLDCTSFAQIAVATSTSFSDTGLNPSTTYRYRVRATDAAANLSGYSDVETASTPAAVADTQPPTAPAGLVATAVLSTQANLSWIAATDNVAVTAYLIERCTGVNCTSFTQIAATASTSFSNNGLSPLTTYSYRVRATDAAANLSAYSGLVTVTTLSSTSSHTDVTTYKNDLARTGQNLNESILTLANVNSSSFGLLRVLAADGAVYAQPLYLAQLMIGGIPHNVVFVVTQHNSVYAYDADSGAQLWHTSLSPSGETSSDTRGCDQIDPEIGVTATPVIDRAAGPAGVIYVVAMSKDAANNYHQRLHALDVTTGSEFFGGPREIQAIYPNQSGTTTFDPGAYKERAALLLLNGEVYTSWASHCDELPYSGWIIAYSQSGVLQQTQVLNIGPNSQGDGPGIWQGGGGPAADSAGNIYIMAGNGAFEPTLDANGFPSAQDYGNSYLKISTAGQQLAVVDYFAMWNAVSESVADLDLGASGPILLPDLTDGTGKVKHLAAGAGKDGNVYIVDRDSMSKFNSSRNNIWQELDGALAKYARSTGAYFNGRLYLADVGPLKAFSITGAKLSTAPTSVSVALGYPGGPPVVSAHGNSNGIVWAIDHSGVVILHAFDATNLAVELYNSNQAANGRDKFGVGVKFTAPTVADGKVFVGSKTGVGVFGLLH